MFLSKNVVRSCYDGINSDIIISLHNGDYSSVINVKYEHWTMLTQTKAHSVKIKMFLALVSD